MRIGIICPSEIALRRFMPALVQSRQLFEFAGIGVYSKEERFSTDSITEKEFREAREKELEKANVFIKLYGGRIFESYNDIVSSPDIEAIYIPLPPALHYKWARKALESGKHVMVEKPATIALQETLELILLAKQRNLAFHENYMFIFHQQLDEIERIINGGVIGDIRLYRISFGFPRRDINDFRYNKALGGGALIDAGGYAILYSTRLLGQTARIVYAQSNYVSGFDVDMYGSAALVNDQGTTVQIAFGMDNNYKCDLEIWGSKGSFHTGRVLTAPAGFTPIATIRKGNEEIKIDLPSDDAFKKSIEFFNECINNKSTREKRYETIKHQAELIDEFTKHSCLR